MNKNEKNDFSLHSRLLHNSKCRPRSRFAEAVNVNRSNLQANSDNVSRLHGLRSIPCECYRRNRITLQLQHTHMRPMFQRSVRVNVAFPPTDNLSVSRTGCKKSRIHCPVTRPYDARMDAVLFVGSRCRFERAVHILEQCPSSVSRHRQQISIVGGEFHLGYG